MTPFDIINAINNKTKIEWDAATEKVYPPFLINRGLSFNVQTVMFANVMNQFYQIDKKMQYDFYFHGVPKGKRYDKWIKKPNETPEDVQLISDYYNINITKAADALLLLSNDQINVIKNKMNKGGRK